MSRNQPLLWSLYNQSSWITELHTSEVPLALYLQMYSSLVKDRELPITETAVGTIPSAHSVSARLLRANTQEDVSLPVLPVIDPTPLSINGFVRLIAPVILKDVLADGHT